MVSSSFADLPSFTIQLQAIKPESCGEEDPILHLKKKRRWFTYHGKKELVSLTTESLNGWVSVPQIKPRMFGGGGGVGKSVNGPPLLNPFGSSDIPLMEASNLTSSRTFTLFSARARREKAQTSQVSWLGVVGIPKFDGKQLGKNMGRPPPCTHVSSSFPLDCNPPSLPSFLPSFLIFLLFP
mmetsp:Transcript_26411/g.67394  ORF Transcript_26411/g.67394 Transcript_26411/m.67394 type:complete len:182 (+) Transcript_26411:3346-3891(+)